MKIRKQIVVLSLLLLLLTACSAKGKTTGASEKEKEASAKEETTEETNEEELPYRERPLAELEVLSYDGDAEAAYTIALFYDYGTEEINQNFEKAAEWYEKAAEQSVGAAHTALGYRYLHGIGTEVSLSDAIREFEQAASLGDSCGHTGLGRVYLYAFEHGIALPDTGDGVDVPPEEQLEETAKRAFTCFQRAYQAKAIDAACYLGTMYEKGIGTTVDETRALSLYDEVLDAAEEEPSDVLQNRASYADVEYAYLPDAARTRKGLLLLNGSDAIRNEKEAYECLATAAEHGYTQAQYYLGLFYLQGLGTGKDDDKAFDEMFAAAEKEYAPALNQLGCFYYNGIGTDRDLNQAVYFQKRAAAQGYAPAQVNLGYLYENGYGVERNLHTARAYYSLAAEQGYEGAPEAMTRVETLLNE